VKWGIFQQRVREVRKFDDFSMPKAAISAGAIGRYDRMRSSLMVAGFLLLSTFVMPAQTSLSPQSGDDQEHFQWLLKSLDSIQTMKVGMTRRELLTLFREDGGVQFVPIRYVYKQCPVIKVDVAFTANDAGDRSNDRIKSISKPYLESPFFD
jgi:hypothetical protein